MSVNSSPGTSSQAAESKISETTNREDKGQNQDVIDWLRRVKPGRPFLKTGNRVWTYGETLAEVTSRVVSEPVVLAPELVSGSVFGLLAGIGGGGVVVVDPGEHAPIGPVDGAALVVFTSGTSGSPKGVRLTHENLVAASSGSVAHLDHDSDDTWLLAIPLGHVAGLSIVVRSAYAGGSVRLLPGFDPVSFARALHGDVTMVSVVPAMLRSLIDHDAGPYRGLKAVLVGGGPIPDGLLEEAAAAGMPVLPTYGMTETFGQVATLRPGAPVERKAHPLPGVDLRIEKDRRIAVRGQQVSPGYLGEPNRGDEWLVTNDLGEIDSDGALRVLGRSDTVIITGGENVDPARVESEIGTLEGVEEVVVSGVPDDRWGEVLVAVYAGTAEPEDLRAAMGTHLPRHMIPTRWVTVNAIPRTPLGKPDRAAARALILSERPPTPGSEVR